MRIIIPVEKNREYELKIESLTAEGQGVGRIEGFTVFVPQTAAGDVIRARIVKVKSSYAFGIVQEILVPSPDRQQPPCLYADKCGGCQLMHIQYEKQLLMKQKIIQDAIVRIGGVEIQVPPVIGMPAPFRYRNKMIFPVGTDRQGKTVCGFYRERSHDIIPITDCLLGDAVNQAIIQAVLAYMTENQVPAYDEVGHTGVIRRIFTRRSHSTGEIMVVISANANSLKCADRLVEALRKISGRIVSILLNINRKRTNTVLGPENRVLYGKEYIKDQLCGLWFAISPQSFFQVNPEQTEKLYETALQMAGLTGRETVLDLYCGIGTISLLAAKRAKQVIGVEIVPQAIEDARENARQNGVSNVDFYAADAQELVPQLIANGIRPSVVLLDPPRKGSDPQTLAAIVQSGAERVVYVSCNPATLARDIRILCGTGYTVQKVVGVDLFPWTYHVETVVSLVRKTPNDYIHVKLDLDDLDLTAAEAKATYSEIKEYVLEKFGLKVSSLYIAQIKEKYGIIERENYNLPKTEGNRVPKCPKEKEDAIVDALKHFKMI